MHICVNKQNIIVTDHGLLPGWCQDIIWTNAGLLSIRSLGTNFSEILSEILSFSFKKIHLNVSSTKWQQFCFGLNVLTHWDPVTPWLWALEILVNTGSGNGLLLDGNKPLAAPLLTYDHWCPVAITWRQFCNRYLGHQLITLATKLL